MIDRHHVLSDGTLERHVQSRKMFLKNITNVFPKTHRPLVIQLQWTLMFSPTKCLYNIGKAYVFHQVMSMFQCHHSNLKFRFFQNVCLEYL